MKRIVLHCIFWIGLFQCAYGIGQLMVTPLVAYIDDGHPSVRMTLFNQTGQSVTVRSTVTEYDVGTRGGVYGQDVSLAEPLHANILDDIVELSPKVMVLPANASQVVRVRVKNDTHIKDGVYAFGLAFKTDPERAETVMQSKSAKQEMAAGVQFVINNVAALYFTKGRLNTAGSIDGCYINLDRDQLILLVTNTGSNYYKPEIQIKDGQGKVITQTYFGLLMPKSRGVRYIWLSHEPVPDAVNVVDDSTHVVRCFAYEAGVSRIPGWNKYHQNLTLPN